MTIIKPYGPEHRQRVIEIVRAVAPCGYVTTESRDALAPAVARDIDVDVQAWVAIMDGAANGRGYDPIVVGYTAIGKGRSLTVVDPKWQGKKIGQTLMAYKNANVRPFETIIGATNIASIRAALAAGMRVIGADENENGRIILIFRGGNDG